MKPTGVWQAACDKHREFARKRLNSADECDFLSPFNSARRRDPNVWTSAECYQQHLKELCAGAERARQRKKEQSAQVEEKKPKMSAAESLELAIHWNGPDASYRPENLDPGIEYENAEFIRKDGKFRIKFLHPINVHQCIEEECMHMKSGILKLKPYGEKPLRALVTIFNLLNISENYLRSLCQENGLEFVSFRFCGPLGEWKYIASCPGNAPEAETVCDEIINAAVADNDLGFVPTLPIINAVQKRNMRSQTAPAAVKIEEELVNEVQPSACPSSPVQTHSSYIHRRLEKLIKHSRLQKRKPIAEICSSSFGGPCRPLWAKNGKSVSVLSNDHDERRKTITLHSKYTSAQLAALFEVLLRRLHRVKWEEGESVSTSPDESSCGTDIQDQGNTEIWTALRDIFEELDYDTYLLHPMGYESWVASLEAEGSALFPIVKDMLPLLPSLLSGRRDVGCTPITDTNQSNRIDNVSSIVSLLCIFKSSHIEDKNDFREWLMRYAGCDQSNDNQESHASTLSQSKASQDWEHHLLAALSYDLSFTECFLLMQNTLRYETGKASPSDALSDSLAYTLLDFYCNGNRSALVDRLFRANADWTLSFITATLLHEDLDFDPLNEIYMRFATQLVREGLFGCAAAACLFSPDCEMKGRLFKHIVASYKGRVLPM